MHRLNKVLPNCKRHLIQIRTTDPPGWPYTQKSPLWGFLFGWKTGLEPATSGITIRRSNQLSYIHHFRQAIAERGRKYNRSAASALLCSRMHVLVLPKWYPGRNDPQLGVFIRKQTLAVAAIHRVSVVYACPVKALSVAQEQVLETADGAWELRCYYRSNSLAIKPLRKLLNYGRYMRAIRNGTNRVLNERGKPDLVHAHILTRPVYAAWRLARRLGIPFLISEQSSEHLNGTWGKKNRWGKALDRFLVQRAARLIAVSPHLAKALEKLVPSSPVAVVPNILPTIDISPSSAGPAGHFLMVADLVDRIKNVSGVLRALQLVRTQGNDIRLEIIGDGPDRMHLEELATALGVNEHVEWMGRLANADVLKRMAHAGTVVINSNFETFSVVTGEALALGKPVIATKCGGPEAFITPANGILVPIGDDRALSTAMAALYHGHGRYSPRQVQATVGAVFSKEAVADCLDVIYKEVTGHG